MMETRLYGTDTGQKLLPLVLLNCDEDGQRVYDLCKELGSPDFILAALGGFDWNGDLSPWRQEAIFRGGAPFAGKADQYLTRLETLLLPQIEKQITEQDRQISRRIIAGYSLAGLFALYAACNSDLFHGIVSASASLWYPDFTEYMSTHPLSDSVKKVYLSLGDKESRTANPVMKTVEENTKRIHEILLRQTDAFFEYNPGNHFNDPELRLAKGIVHILNA